MLNILCLLQKTQSKCLYIGFYIKRGSCEVVPRSPPLLFYFFLVLCDIFVLIPKCACKSDLINLREIIAGFRLTLLAIFNKMMDNSQEKLSYGFERIFV